MAKKFSRKSRNSRNSRKVKRGGAAANSFKPLSNAECDTLLQNCLDVSGDTKDDGCNPQPTITKNNGDKITINRIGKDKDGKDVIIDTKENEYEYDLKQLCPIQDMIICEELSTQQDGIYEVELRNGSQSTIRKKGEEYFKKEGVEETQIKNIQDFCNPLAGGSRTKRTSKKSSKKSYKKSSKKSYRKNSKKKSSKRRNKSRSSLRRR